jgi:predicted RNA-binding protein YlqC (UPF0109 family)
MPLRSWTVHVRKSADDCGHALGQRGRMRAGRAR